MAGYLAAQRSYREFLRKGGFPNLLRSSHAGRHTVELSEPVAFKGINRSSLSINLDIIGPVDLSDFYGSAEGRESFETDVIPPPLYQHVAAKAAGVPVEFIRKLSRLDGLKVSMIVHRFMMR